MVRYLTVVYTLLLVLTLASRFVHAQEDETALESDEQNLEDVQEVDALNGVDYFSDIPEDFSGTLDEQDTDSEKYRETELFGSDEILDEDDDGAENAGLRHLLRLEFQGQVVITDTLTGIAFLQVTYDMKAEQEVQIWDKRFRAETEGQANAQVVGELTSNEISSCGLDVQIPNPKMSLMLRHSQTEETEETEATSQLAIRVMINKNDIKEDWYANCTDTSGNTMNTKGEQEEYLFSLLRSTSPELKGFVIEDFDPFVSVEQDIVAEPLIVEDPEAFEEFFLQGSGTLTIEPIE